MKKFYVVLALLLITGLFAVSAAQAASSKKIPVLVAGPPAKWSTYAITVGTADIVNRKTNLNLTVRSYGGALTIVQALVAKQGDLAAGPRDPSFAMAYYAFDKFKGKTPAKDLRAVIAFLELVKSIIVRSDSDIKTIADLKGKRLPRYTATSSRVEEALIKAYGLNLDKDIVWVNLPGPDKALEELKRGRLDAAFTSLRGADILELVETIGKIRPLPIAAKKLSMLREAQPQLVAGLTSKTLKPGWLPYLDVSAPVSTLTTPMIVGTRADVSENVIYAYIKAWLDNIEEVKLLSSDMKGFGSDIIKTPSALPYHRAAIKALKEVGMWTAAMEKAHQAALNR